MSDVEKKNLKYARIGELEIQESASTTLRGHRYFSIEREGQKDPMNILETEIKDLIRLLTEML